jgi:enterochelin esterase-like enzyme
VSRFHTLLSITFLPLALLGLTGCEKLQPGYYLTPENYPTSAAAVPGVTPESTPAATATPPSTVLVLPTQTPEPSPTQTPAPAATSTPVICTELQGTIVRDSFMSQIAGNEVHYRIYLPPCYAATGRRYPYIIMLHGLVPGTDIMNDGQWDQLGLDEAADQGYAQGALPPVVIVMPNGNDADYAYDAGRFPEVVAQELVPVIESRYCVQTDSAHRALGGLSRGGYWAFWIAFANPELFDRVGGHSPFFYTAQYASDKNPDNLVDAAPRIERLTMYFDHGQEDYVSPGVQDFVARLQRRGITPEYVINPTGSHTEDYWAAHVADYLLFYTADWPRSIEELPDCEAAGAGS